MNQELKKIARWLCANKLTLNIKKTHFIIFKSKKRKLNQTVSIKINEQPIELVKYTKFLGVYIDEELSWKHHIDQVVSKISQMTGIMAKVRHYLSLKTNSRQFITLWYIRTWRTAISFWTLVLIQPGWNHYSGFRKKLLESWPFAKYNKESRPLLLQLQLPNIQPAELFHWLLYIKQRNAWS